MRAFSCYYLEIFPIFVPISQYSNYMNCIKEVLNEKGIKQTWLAEKLDKSFKIVNAYACNRQQPPLDTLYRIAEILQVSVKDLLVDDKGK